MGNDWEPMCIQGVYREYFPIVWSEISENLWNRVPQKDLLVPLEWIECGYMGILIIIYPKPYSIYSRGTIVL